MIIGCPRNLDTRQHHYTYPTTPAGRTLDAVTHAGITTTAYMDGAGYEISRDSTIAATGATISRSVSSTDAAGRVTGWRIASQDASTACARTFDGAGRQITSTDPAWTAAAEVAYDTAARESRRTLPYASSLGGPRSSEMTYTVDGRLRQVTGAGAASYSYDASGNVCSFTRAAHDPHSFNLAYDSAGRLASLTASGTSTATTVYTFDTANGRRVAQGPPSNRTQAVFGYSDNGRLSSYDTSSGVHAAYTFDATGQRTRSVVTSGSLTTTTTFAYEGLTLLSACATDSAGATWTIAYLYDAEGRSYAGVETAENTSTIFRIVTDERGDVVALTDTTGDPFARYDYDEYGNPLSTLTRASTRIAETTAARIAARQMLRYAGYAFDSENGMYYCSAREYDPFTMQFLQKDPAKADGESSAYQYCGGDPVGKVDPSGMQYAPARARRYASVFYASPNPAWKDHGGENCTDFVSQCLYAGGLRDDAYNGTYGNRRLWWADAKRSSPEWSAADRLYEYLTVVRGFQTHLIPGREYIATVRSNQANRPPGGWWSPSMGVGYVPWARQGDVVFYRHRGARVTHAALVVDSSPITGTLRAQSGGRAKGDWRVDVRGTPSETMHGMDYIFVRPR